MAEYEVLYSKTTQIRNGVYGDQTVASSFIRATEANYRRYYRCEFGVRVVVFSDLRCYISADGGGCWQSAMPHGDAWAWPRSFLNASLRSFRMRVAANQDAGYYQLQDYNMSGWGSWVTKYCSKTPSEGDDGWGVTFETFTTCIADSCSSNSCYTFTVPYTLSGTGQGHGYDEYVPFAAAQSVPAGTKVDTADLNAYMMGKGYRYLGNLRNSDFGGANEGVVYIGGLALFNSSSTSGTQFEIDAAKIVIPELYQLLDYYPCAIRKGASWPACNRTGGFVKIRKGGWRDAKNSYGEGTSTVFIRKGGQWVKSREGV